MIALVGFGTGISPLLTQVKEFTALRVECWHLEGGAWPASSLALRVFWWAL